MSLARPARADRVSPQLAFSFALGTSGHGPFGHLWAGAGANLVDASRSGPFVLAGVEADFRGRVEGHVAERSSSSAPEPRDNELWIAARFGTGSYGAVALVPKVATYLITGARVAGLAGEPRMRLGVGVSLPAALALAQLGIPTMLETGLDVGGDDHVRGFLRAGWNL